MRFSTEWGQANGDGEAWDVKRFSVFISTVVRGVAAGRSSALRSVLANRRPLLLLNVLPTDSGDITAIAGHAAGRRPARRGTRSFAKALPQPKKLRSTQLHHLKNALVFLLHQKRLPFLHQINRSVGRQSCQLRVAN